MKTQNNNLNIRMSDELMNQLYAAAEHADIPYSRFVRDAIEEKIQREGIDKPR